MWCEIRMQENKEILLSLIQRPQNSNMSYHKAIRVTNPTYFYWVMPERTCKIMIAKLRKVLFKASSYIFFLAHPFNLKK